MIQSYDDFVAALLDVGFSAGGGINEGISSIVSWSWEEEPPYDTPVRWHTGDPVTDPWEWRMRVLDERCDIAYAKLFFRKSGYITKDWYPYFLAIRRGGRTFEEDYAAGIISHFAKRIYDTVSENGALPVHVIKQLAGFHGKDKSGFDRALTELQMRMYLTMCGQRRKLSKKGIEYSWPSSVLCTTESFFDDEVFKRAAELDSEEAAKKLTGQIIKLNPAADSKKISKFIRG